jgi:glycosyltransferase involved in cell wall biosynthesis
MKIATLHNHYQQPGGEDQVFAAEGTLLEEYGHTVVRLIVHNDSIADMGKLALAKATVWNSQQYHAVQELLAEHKPDVLHVHNTLPILSPAVYYAAKAEGVPVVQTLHNYRYSCVNGLFFRDGAVCEDCLGKAVSLPGVIHGCYRDSRAASAVVAGMLAFHKLRRTYVEMVDVYIALTEFSRQKFVDAGLPKEKIMVKPNFVASDPGVGRGQGGYALYVGRLSQEKGLDTLLDTWQGIETRLPLKIVGDGPLWSELIDASPNGVEFLGRQPRNVVTALMQDATVLILPSVCYENFPMTIAEAFACGLTVITTNHGAMASIVEHDRLGRVFRPGDANDLTAQVDWVLAHLKELEYMRLAVRQEYELKYTAKHNYDALIQIYERAINGG